MTASTDIIVIDAHTRKKTKRQSCSSLYRLVVSLLIPVYLVPCDYYPPLFFCSVGGSCAGEQVRIQAAKGDENL